MLKYVHLQMKKTGRSIIWTIEVNNLQVQHEDAITAFKKQTGLAEDVFDCLGGGGMWIFQDEKRISIGSRSLKFGPDIGQKKTIELIQERYPDYTVTTF